MKPESQDARLGKGLAPGSHHYRAFIGQPELYDVCCAIQFNLLTFLGLREDHFLLDIGCGSLGPGRLFITYLLPGHYFGIEPEQWLIEEGIKNELGRDIINIKAPTFSNDGNFSCTNFARKFDYFLAQSIFSHASQAQIRRCISQVKECMKPTSIFAATFWKGDKNYRGEDWDYSTCITYTMERMEEFALEQGLICRPIEWPHPTQQWVLIAHPENERRIQDLCDATNPYISGKQLQSYKEKLKTLESHPYVRFGLVIKRTLSRINRIFSRKSSKSTIGIL